MSKNKHILALAAAAALVAGCAGSGSTGVCKRHELASWAAHAVAADADGWLRVTPAESAELAGKSAH